MREPSMSERRGLSAANRPGAVIRVSEDECLVRSENGVRRYRVRRIDSDVWACECQCYQTKRTIDSARIRKEWKPEDQKADLQALVDGL